MNFSLCCCTGLFCPKCRTLCRNIGFIFCLLWKLMGCANAPVRCAKTGIQYNRSSYFIFSSNTYRASVIVFPYKNVLNYGGSNTCSEWELEVLYKHHNSEVLSYFKQSSQSPITDSFSLTTGKSNKAIYAQLAPNNYILVSVVIAFPK